MLHFLFFPLFKVQFFIEFMNLALQLDNPLHIVWIHLLTERIQM